MRAWMGALLTCTLVAYGCSSSGESSSTTGAGGTSTSTSTSTSSAGGVETTTATTTTSATTTSATGTSTGATTSTSTSTASSSSSGGGPMGVVINEISAKGDDWVELANAGIAGADLGGNGLCDSDDTGACNLAGILRFPAGTKLAPGEHLLIVGNKDPDDAGVGPFSDCLADGGPMTCFHVTWKVSASKGEKVHYIAVDDTPIDEVLYPKDAVLDGETWGRFPDLTGDFVATKPTPGAANQ